jgi:hypothetical protein
MNASIRPVLVYRSTCARCRLLSRLAVLFSLNRIERVPSSSERAAAITEHFPGERGKLLLLTPEGRATGREVFVQAVRCSVRSWFVRP